MVRPSPTIGPLLGQRRLLDSERWLVSGVMLRSSRWRMGTLVGYPTTTGGVVKARLGWALLLLTAVFTMHGLQCMSAEPMDAAALDQGAVVMDMTPVDAHGPHAPAGIAIQADADMATQAASGEVPDGHSAAVHALMVCLAVLAGGVGVALAALAAWLARSRSRTALRRAADAVRVCIDRHRPSLPSPDITRLCVLRI